MLALDCAAVPNVCQQETAALAQGDWHRFALHFHPIIAFNHRTEPDAPRRRKIHRPVATSLQPRKGRALAAQTSQHFGQGIHNKNHRTIAIETPTLVPLTSGSQKRTQPKATPQTPWRASLLALDCAAVPKCMPAKYLKHETQLTGTHHRGNNCRTRASPKRSSINITTPSSCWLRITRPAACTTF